MSSMFSGAIGASVSSMTETGKRTEEYAGNIANIDTVGFKGFEAHANSIVNSTGKSAGGVTSVTRQLVDQQGKMQRTDVSTDLAMDGPGFFVVTNKLTSDGDIDGFAFTKAGSFRRNEIDQFANAAGYLLTAWPVDADGNLPATKSLTSSLELVNVRQLVSEASSTTNLEFGANLKADQTVVGGGVNTINITNIGPKGSPNNYSVSKDDILFPSVENTLTKGDGLNIEMEGVHKKLLYGGFAQSFYFNNAGTELVGSATDELQIQVGNRLHSGILRGAGTTNAEVLANLEKQINQVTGEQAIKCRVVNNGASSTLMVAPDKADYSMTFAGGLTFRNALGFDDTKNIEQFTIKDGSDLMGRFASLQDLSDQFNKIGMEAKVFSSDSVGAALTFSSVKPTAINNFTPSGAGSDFLSEFGLTKGFLKSDYDPYDPQNNMAGRAFKPHYSRDFPVYDSMGNKHDMLIGFTKINTNKWAVEVYAVDPSEVDVTGRTDGLLQAGIVTFDGKGHLQSIQSTTQASYSKDLGAPQAALGATAGQTLTVTIGSSTHSYTYGKMIASSDLFVDTNTDLVGTATDTLDVTVNGTTYNIARGAGATNIAVMKNMATQINATTGDDAIIANVVYDKSTDKYHLDIRPKVSTNAVTFAETPATTIGTDLNITSADDIASNSFESLYDLAEQMNTTEGPDAIHGTVITGNTNGSFRIKIEPKNPSQYMTFGGTDGIINVPLGTGVTQKIADALGLKNTSSSTQIAGLSDSMIINWSNTIGADANVITTKWGDIGATNGLGQVSGDYAIKRIEQNGVSTGQLNGIQVDGDGFIVATFTNSQTRKIYKLAIADFPNPNGLIPGPGNTLTVSRDSGPLNLKEAGKEGVGRVLSGTLEGSNVDIADQLTKLILAQRQYQASSKVINVVDKLMEDLIHRTFS